MSSLIASLKERGFVDAVTHPDLDSILHRMGTIRVYCGFDPTGSSLHLGNLIALIGLSWFRRAGHDIVALIGGATGMIGDPSGKSTERSLLDEITLRSNVEKISEQITSLLSRVPGKGTIEIVNNRDWYGTMSCLDFLRDIGKNFRVGTMLSKESVRSRMESEEGMSYTEFSYQILQGHDFYHLFSKKNILIQLGGRDQWGNITAGTEYIRKMTGEDVYGVTFPLLTKSDGQKFGKSEKGALWLSSELLSEYDLYQYLVRVTDKEVIPLLKMLTFLPHDEIIEIERSMSSPSYVPNEAQKKLAEEVVRFVHDTHGLEKALIATNAIMPGHVLECTNEGLAKMAASLPSVSLPRSSVVGVKVIDLALIAKLVPSKSEARRLIKNNGLTLNSTKVSSEDAQIQDTDLLYDKYLVLSSGKKQKAIIEIAPE